MRNFNEDFLLERLARQEKGQEPARRANNPLFLKSIKKEWDDLRPGQRDDSGHLIPDTSFSYFNDVYDQEELEADEKKLAKIKAKREGTRRGPTGEVGEYIIEEGIYSCQWLTEDVEVLPTHEFDDNVNGVDFVLRFDTEDGTPLYLGVDVTTMTDTSVVSKARQQILDYLALGKMQELKYFEDQREDIKGRLELPKIIVVLNKDDAFKMQDVLLNMKKRIKMPVAERQKLLRTEKYEIKDEEAALKKVQADVENEFVAQIEEIVMFLADEIERISKSRSADSEKIKNLEAEKLTYQNILKVINKEA